MLFELIGWTAVILTSVQFIPQAVKAAKTRKLKDVSLWTFVLATLAAVLWLLHGFKEKDYYIPTTNTVVLACTLVILSLKLKHH